MNNLSHYDDTLYYNEYECRISKDELDDLFPQYQPQWDEIFKDSRMSYRINLVPVAWGSLGYEFGGSVLVTPLINNEHLVQTKETFMEQAAKYDELVGATHDFDICNRLDLAETNTYPLAQLYVADPYGGTDEVNQFKLKYGTEEEKEEILQETEAEKESGEYYSLDLKIWEPVKMDRGEYKGMNPVVTSQGNVAVGRKYAGQSVRVFVRK